MLQKEVGRREKREKIRQRGRVSNESREQVRMEDRKKNPINTPFMPPENPLQLAKIISGSLSLLKSLIACAVLYEESGNHTWPACWITYNTHSEINGIQLKVKVRVYSQAPIDSLNVLLTKLNPLYLNSTHGIKYTERVEFIKLSKLGWPHCFVCDIYYTVIIFSIET